MMEKFVDTAILNEQEIEHLQYAIGCRADLLYSRTLTVQTPYALAPSFSFKTSEGSYLNTENEWDESPSGAIDFGRLRIGISEYPKDVNLVDTKVGSQTVKGLSEPCTVDMAPYQKLPVIRSIDIFEREERFKEEYVRYDAAIVFRRGGSSGFYFRPELSGIGRVEFGQQWRDIWDMSVGLKRRARITEGSIDLDPPPA